MANEQQGKRLHPLLLASKDGNTSSFVQSAVSTKCTDTNNRRRSTCRGSVLTEQLLEDAAEILRNQAMMEQSAHSSLCNSIKAVPLLRLANLITLMCMSCLVATGTTNYDTPSGQHLTVHVSIHSWRGENEYIQSIENFDYLSVNGQYFAFTATIILTIETLLLLAARVVGWWPTRMVSMVYAFTAVPILLIIFALEIYYSTCPWIDEYYRRRINAAQKVRAGIVTNCSVVSWSAAAGLAIVSAAICITDGLLACFMRPTEAIDFEHVDVDL